MHSCVDDLVPKCLIVHSFDNLKHRIIGSLLYVFN